MKRLTKGTGLKTNKQTTALLNLSRILRTVGNEDTTFFFSRTGSAEPILSKTQAKNGSKGESKHCRDVLSATNSGPGASSLDIGKVVKRKTTVLCCNPVAVLYLFFFFGAKLIR